MEPKKQSAQIKQLKDQVEELTRALQHERADATNIRRRAEEEKVKLAGYFKAEVIKKLLPFIDNFDRALKHAPAMKDHENWLGGLKTTEKQLQQIMESLGIQKIPTVGQPFNPELHEAVQVEEGGKGGKEVVIEEFTPGYIMGEEVIRHAMVKVSSK